MPSPQPSPLRAAAFFDLDRTLISGSSTFQFARAAYKAGLLSRRQLVTDAFANLRFRLHGSTDARTDALRERIADTFRGVRVRDFQRLAPDVLAGILPRVYPRMLDIAYAHQDAGRPIFICTAAAQEMADLFAVVFLFDGAVGSKAEVVEGYFTGRSAGPFTYREGKAEAIRELAAREGIDLRESWAYSDSESDLPMLRAVGNPVAVNPDSELAEIARAEDWEILNLDRLHGRLRVGVATFGAAAIGAIGSVAMGRRRKKVPSETPKKQNRKSRSGKRKSGRNVP